MGLIKVFDRGVAVGDILYVDSSANPKKMFARPSEVGFLPTSGTYTQTVKGVSTTYTAPFTSVGVVVHVNGRKVYVINKTSGGALQYKTENTADGTASNMYYRKNGSIARNRGIMNTTRGVAYWGSSGRTPTDYETIPSATNSDPVNRTAFETSSYCKLLRQTYGNYENYISEGMGVKFPQEYGCFGLADAKTITYTYNDSEHPAFQHCASVTYGVDGLAAGDWYMPGVYEGTAFMRDAVLAKVNASLTKIGGATISNSATRWFAQRYNDTNAWIFSGINGTLNNYNCASTAQVQAIVLLIV